jgi:hypothetical protein
MEVKGECNMAKFDGDVWKVVLREQKSTAKPTQTSLSAFQVAHRQRGIISLERR